MIILAALLATAAPAAPPPLQPDEIVAAAPATAWRTIAPENLMLVESAAGTMVVELAPNFAPQHVAAIRTLVNAGRFDGGAITRVQDNYVVQWAVKPLAGASGVGQPPDQRPLRTRPKPLPPEYERPLKGLSVTPLGSPDAYAEGGFADGWPVGVDRKEGKAWLAHCYAHGRGGARHAARHRRWFGALCRHWPWPAAP